MLIESQASGKESRRELQEKVAKALEKAGAHVIYGIKGFKVHAKATLITRRKNGKLKQYAHLGTGNYNPATSKIYTPKQGISS